MESICMALKEFFFFFLMAEIILLLKGLILSYVPVYSQSKSIQLEHRILQYTGSRYEKLI